MTVGPQEHQLLTGIAIVAQNRQTTRSVLQLFGVAGLFLLASVALVSYKVELWPWELNWLDGRALSSVVSAVIHESRFELAALAIAALNFLWALIRLTSNSPIEQTAFEASTANHALMEMPLDDEAAESADPFDKAMDNTPAPTAAVAVAAQDRGTNSQLQITTAELSRLKKDLVGCRQQLEAANQAKSQFLNNISHELRTPMNGIMGMTELLLNGELPPRERRFASSVAASADALLNIINDLLDFSKIEAGTLYLERSRFNVRNCVEDVCAMLAESAHVKGIELICYVDDDMPAQVDGDANRVRQILTNLITNAIAFTSSGEVVVRMTRLDDVDKQHVLQCDVQDTGAGIAPELQATLFEAFTQADTSNTRRHGGLGMGLAIAQQLISMMGGEITFRSRLGEGSRFTYSMKLDRVSDGEQDAPQRRSLQGARALVVDDNETNRTILYHQLSSWGILVDTVDSGASALSYLQEATTTQQPYDVLVLDLNMPDMDGVELARKIAADPQLAGVKSLMLTSAVLELSSSELSAIGIDRYISKPARQSLLHDSLAALMPHVAGAMPIEAPVDPAVRFLPVRAKVLLAEDNVVNQDVAVSMLEQLGCEVDMVPDGRGAVELCQSKSFDVIFMDCQMPLMDGFEATRAIKASDGDNVDTPIIALTANAMDGDRERCIDNGMDDYLSKPVRQEQLHASMVKWAADKVDTAAAGMPKPSKGAGSEPVESARVVAGNFPAAAPLAPPSHSQRVDEAPASVFEINSDSNKVYSLDFDLGDDRRSDVVADVPLINEKAIDTIRSLQRPGKEDLLGKVVQVYFDKTPGLISDMQQAVKEGDLDEVKASAHSLKSSSAYVGADSLSDKCRRIESAAAAEDWETIARLADSIAGEYEAVAGELNGLLKAA